MPAHVYVIHSDADTAIAERVSSVLREAGFSVWSAETIPLGQDWTDSISAADVVTVILSPDANESERVREEISSALRLGKRIIPILARGDFKNSIPQTLRHINALDIRAGYDALEQLIETLAPRPVPYDRRDEYEEPLALEEEPPEPEPAPPPSGAAAAPPAPAPAQSVAEKPQEAQRERAEPTPARPEVPPEPAGAFPSPLGGLIRRLSGLEVPLEPPIFAAFFPEFVAPGTPYALMVFAHVEAARQTVEEIAAGVKGLMGGRQQSASAASAVRVDVGNLLTFVPQIAGIQCNPAAQVVTWQPPYQSATFLFATPPDLQTDLVGRVLVYQGPLIVGEIPVKMKRLAAGAPASIDLNKSGEFKELDPVFASYAHRDMPVMEYFRRARANMGQRMLVDIYDLRSGEHWADRLLEMIEQSAAFQLFWSRHSAQSRYCRQEWEYALQVAEREQRPRFVQPVWWAAPMPDPPSELAALHFQKVTLPTLTRAQWIAGQLRGVFRGK